MIDETQVEIGEGQLAEDDFWDARRLGGIIWGAMRGEGYGRVDDLVLDIEQQTGYRVSAGTIGGICSGKRLPAMNTLIALMLTLNMRWEDLTPAVREPYREAYRKTLR